MIKFYVSEQTQLNHLSQVHLIYEFACMTKTSMIMIFWTSR